MTGASQRLRCVILTTGGWRVEGFVHVMPGTRLTDMMNSTAKPFVAVTDAVVRDADERVELFKPPYLAVNREQVAVIFPLDE